MLDRLNDDVSMFGVASFDLKVKGGVSELKTGAFRCKGSLVCSKSRDACYQGSLKVVRRERLPFWWLSMIIQNKRPREASGSAEDLLGLCLANILRNKCYKIPLMAIWFNEWGHPLNKSMGSFVSTSYVSKALPTKFHSHQFCSNFLNCTGHKVYDLGYRLATPDSSWTLLLLSVSQISLFDQSLEVGPYCCLDGRGIQRGNYGYEQSVTQKRSLKVLAYMRNATHAFFFY